MKLFLREQVPLLIFTIVQLFVVLLVFWFDGYNRLSTALYAVFLGVCMLIVFLVYRFLSHRAFYKRLSHPPAMLNETIEPFESTPLPTALHELLTAQYGHYASQLKSWEHKHQKHVTFMNHWVHQMKTPLSVIELITDDGDDPRLESISEEADRIRQGLEMVLYMARLETFEQDFHVDQVSLKELVNEVIHINKRLFIRSYVYPEIHVDAIFSVNTDAKWLRFILQQLVSNAIKYSEGSRENVTVSVSSQGRAVILEIRDRGVGIPASDIARVCNPFFTGENGRAFKESTGMGLYLVKEVLDKLNHEFQIESVVGKGTTVRVIFPYAAE
ncbi:HAMP domain-containing histidine kinase [Paenibacillus sp. SYP-B3998]|uniref:histidine kinase n=1 Tax=Paenibacillus sp. SYP-B3998 TaxID=2678564 RepID=A0A6G3ZRZ5_9BACL|nr:sensor histidine kinase [Paenibacillus sp. SYP-B3998]NEW04808.1 HAMP domain-containing histidine kinase [Paenibacillus sp. SYP-B3998]